MKAVVCDRYGPPEVLRLEDVERPVNGQAYDVIFDAVGKHSFGRCRDSLNRAGSTWPPTVCTTCS